MDVPKLSEEQINKSRLDKFKRFVTHQLLGPPKILVLLFLLSISDAYKKGFLVKQNLDKADCWLWQIVNLDDALKLDLIRCWYAEKPGSINEKDLFKSTYKGAEKGDPVSYSNLAMCYLSGIGTEIDYSKAASCAKIGELLNCANYSLLGFCIFTAWE